MKTSQVYKVMVQSLQLQVEIVVGSILYSNCSARCGFNIAVFVRLWMGHIKFL